MSFYAAMLAWLWPIALGLIDGLFWLFTGHPTGLVAWDGARVGFCAGWVLVPAFLIPVLTTG